MKKKMLFAFVTVMLSLLFGQSVFATVDTRLTFIGNTYNSPSPGKGTLAADVEAKSNDGNSYDITGFQDAFQMDATLRAQNPSVSFSEQFFPSLRYNATEDYRSSDGRVRYVYTYDSGSFSTIGTNWIQIVRVTIEYTMTDTASTVSWYTGNPNFFVIDSSPVVITGSELAISSELNDFSLPVELSSFTASADDIKVTLKWETGSEVGNIGFYVYRSETAYGPFKKISSLIDGAGNSAIGHTYEHSDKDVQPNKTYFYYLEDIDVQGIRDKSDTIKITVPLPKEPPKENRLFQNFPNPFNPETWIPFQLAKASDVDILIYDTTGKLVKTIHLGLKQAEVYKEKSKVAYWDGRNKIGEKVAGGVYFYELQTDKFSAVKKMVLVK